MKQYPSTSIGWFLATFTFKKYPFILRYRVILINDNRHKSFARIPNYSFNAAALYIVNLLKLYPKGTRIGHSWTVYGDKPLGEIKYTSIYDLRATAIAVLMGVRDFFDSGQISREEQGDKSLDYILKSRPVGIGGSRL